MDGKGTLRPGASITVGRSRLRKAPLLSKTVGHLGLVYLKKKSGTNFKHVIFVQATTCVRSDGRRTNLRR